MSMNSQDYADLAQDAYNTPEKENGKYKPVTIGQHKYVVLDHHDNAKTGYQGTIYQRVDTEEIVVAHRGTEFDREAFRDGLQADGGMVFKRSNQQASDAVELTRKALQMAQDQAGSGQAPPVTVTGHSLGGTLAQVSAHHFDLKGETFNAYGANSLGLRIPSGGTSVTNHVMAGDAVSAASAHYGQVKAYAQPQEIATLAANGYDNTTHWSDPLRGYSLVNLATGTTPPTTSRAAVAMGDSHKMHHFTAQDASGQPDRSVLGDPAALQRAQDHAVAIGEYRGDVKTMRSTLTVISRGGVGNGKDAVDALRGPLPPGEPARREKAAAEPAARPSSTSVPEPGPRGELRLEPEPGAAQPVRHASAAGPRAQPLSPLSQTLLQDSEKQVRQLASTHGLPWDRGLDNTVHSLARSAREQGLTGINLLRVNGEGQIRYGQHDGYTLKDGTLDARLAANTPTGDSVERMAQLDQQPAHARHHPPDAQLARLQAQVQTPEPLTRAM